MAGVTEARTSMAVAMCYVFTERYNEEKNLYPFPTNIYSVHLVMVCPNARAGVKNS